MVDRQDVKKQKKEAIVPENIEENQDNVQQKELGLISCEGRSNLKRHCIDPTTGMPCVERREEQPSDIQHIPAYKPAPIRRCGPGRCRR